MRNTCLLALAIMVTGIGLVVASAIFHPTPILVWNASASVPIGLYLVVMGTPNRGSFALVQTPKSVERMANERHYIPTGIPLVKRIAAMTGDYVCASNLIVSINGKPVAKQLEADRTGRSLPRWTDCRKLETDEFFLLADALDSFDSRYFGTVHNNQIMGRLVPIWTE